ncbi:MAG: tRNA 2-thiouridine(34) synthase MnmA, partial [Bdellovibrionales bacterium]
IPCSNCNTYLKFDHLVQKMKELECNYIATGHYARIENQGGELQLISSHDDWKDQTYFLFTLQREILKTILFPIGHLKKPEVREIAVERGLSVAKKKDSTGICFIGKGGYSEFIEQHVAKDLLKPGSLRMYPSGESLGHHEGIHLFTYGQRKGLGIATGTPLYVVRIDATTNTVWLGGEEHLYSKNLTIKNMNWLSNVSEGEEYTVKIRFQHKGARAIVKKYSGGNLELEFAEPQRSITPGQAAVFYRDKALVGGGWIL